MERGQTLEKLQVKVAQYDTALSNVQDTAAKLGRENKPVRLNYTVPGLSELDVSTRITKVVGIRRQIITRTVPKLKEDRTKVMSQIEAHTESRLQANIEFVRSLLGQGATEKELELAEQALKNYQARTAEAQPAPTPPVEKPAEHITQITFNPENGEFTKDGEVVKVPKYFGVLIKYLAEHNGEHPATDFFQALKDAGSKVKIDNTNAYIGTMIINAGQYGLGELIQKDRHKTTSPKNGHFINSYSLSPKFSVTILPATDEETKTKPELFELEEILARLADSRTAIEQAVALGLPGDHPANLAAIDQLIAEKNARLEQLRNVKP